MGYTWKQMDMYFKLCSWFISVILNFDGFCDAYSDQIQSYKMLLKSNRIFCLILVITLENTL